MFNQINARKVEDEYNVFEGLLQSRIFVYIWIFVVAVQVLTVSRFAPAGSLNAAMSLG